MAKVISLINLKGGVGKTTLTVAIADFLSKEYNKKVLVVDLDPQTNATVSLITQEKWKRINDDNHTLHQLYLDKIENTKAFKINKSILKSVGNIKENNNIDLLPSSIDLIDIVEDIIKIEDKKGKLSILDKELGKIKGNYDYILIDCPPDLSSITMTGLYSSQNYIVPIVADTLSVYGLNQLISKIESKVREIKRVKPNYDCMPVGVIVNRFTNTKSEKNIKEALEARDDLPKIFNTNVRALNKIATISTKISSSIPIKSKYGNSYNDIKRLVDEIIREV